MPVTPNLGLRYPSLNDVVDHNSYENLAIDIENELNIIDGIRTQNLHRATVSCTTGGVSLASGTNVNITWSTSHWTIPSGFHSTSSNTDQFVVPTGGLYFMTAQLGFSGFTTLTSSQASLTKGGIGFYVGSGLANAIGGNASVKGLFAASAGDILRVVGNFTGSGTASVAGAMSIYMLAKA